MIIDAHTHIGTMNGREWTPEKLIASMDKAGVDSSLLIADTVIDPVHANEAVIDAAARFDRLKVAVSMDFRKLDEESIEKLLRLSQARNVRAIKIYPGYFDIYPADPRLFPIYEFCQKQGKPVIFHTGILMQGVPGTLKQAHPLNIDEVASQFPKLTIVMAHFGSPWIADALAVMGRHSNVFADLSGYFTEFAPISETQTEMFIRELMQMKRYLGGLQKFLFGTDWPLYDQKEYLMAVERLSMTDEERELVLWKNAKEIFNI